MVNHFASCFHSISILVTDVRVTEMEKSRLTSSNAGPSPPKLFTPPNCPKELPGTRHTITVRIDFLFCDMTISAP
jgi:hypothetical protein